MKLSPAKFNAFLGHIGQQIKWRRSYACPCLNQNSGAAKHNCAQCSGKGRFWIDSVDGVVGIAGSKIQREWAQFGVWESGDTVVSLPSDTPAYDMGQFDRITLTNNTDPFSLTLTRGSNDKLYWPVLTVDRVFWLDSEEEIVEGGIPAVAADGTLSWTSGEPPNGEQYSISGTRHAEYFCWGPHPSDRNMHSGEKLPRRVILRRFDLFGR